MQLNAYEWVLLKLEHAAAILASAEVEELSGLDAEALRERFWRRQADCASQGDPAAARACLTHFASEPAPHPAVVAYVRQALLCFVCGPAFKAQEQAAGDIGADLARAFGLVRQSQGKPQRPPWADLHRDAQLFDAVIRCRAAGYRGYETWETVAVNSDKLLGETLSSSTVEQYWKRVRPAIIGLPIWTDDEHRALRALVKKPELLHNPEAAPALPEVQFDEQRAQCEWLAAATTLGRYLQAALTPIPGSGERPRSDAMNGDPFSRDN